jgi:polar amino acid transport system substrate-binding protein
MKQGSTSIRRALVLGVVLLGASTTLFAQHKLPLFFVAERPPYFEAESGGGLRGIAGVPTEKALKLAGVPFEWVQLPANRLLMTLQANGIPACAPNYFKTPEREVWAKFTKPIFRDEPQVVLAHQGFEPNSTKLSVVLANLTHNVLVKESFSYGSRMDLMLGQAKAQIQTVTVDTPNMAQMIAAKRADFMFVTNAEARALVKLNSLKTVKILRFDDMPTGELRYIMCNQRVEDSVIQKINVKIKFNP